MLSSTLFHSTTLSATLSLTLSPSPTHSPTHSPTSCCVSAQELSAELELANNLMHDRAIHELMHPNSRNNRPQSAHPTLRTVGEEGTGNIDLFAGLRLNDLTSVKEDEKKAEKAPRTRVVASWELRDTEDPLRPQLEFHGHKANKWARSRLQSATVRELMLSPFTASPADAAPCTIAAAASP